MTHTRTILAVLLATVAMACTQNGGHIGRLFGSWVLESATCDGSEMTMPEDTETFWSFQSDLLRVQLADKHHTAENYFGNFTELPDGLLRLDFEHTADNNPDGGGQYAAPQWMGFPATGIFTLRIVSCDSKRMELIWQNKEGQLFVYKFSKTW